MFLRVEECEYLKDYLLRLRFNNGEIVEVDLGMELEGEIFEPLKSLEFFKSVRCNPETNTIEWHNGADFAPEFLYEKGSVLA